MSTQARTYPHDDVGHIEFQVLNGHLFEASRPWPDGSTPTAPNWNPGCSCGHSHYFFEHNRHLAELILAAGYERRRDHVAEQDALRKQVRG